MEVKSWTILEINVNLGESFQLSRRLEQHGALRLRPVEHGDFGVVDGFQFWIDESLEDHARDDATVFQGRAQDFANANVVNVEANRV